MGNGLKDFEQAFAEPKDYSTFLNLFNKYDTNKNGTLDSTEFEGFKKDLVCFIEKNAMGIRRKREAEEAQKKIITNITEELEVSTKLLNSVMDSENKMLENLKSLQFEDLDVNNDKEISYREFANGLSKKMEKNF
eukprot:gene1375-11996_t